jgi:hypothetical protein
LRSYHHLGKARALVPFFATSDRFDGRALNIADGHAD